MGDFLAPKRRDVVDRLRRRIEQYRCHHFRSTGRFDAGRAALFEQNKQETQLLHQRWLESRAKKAAKQSKVKDGGGGGGGGANSQAEHRNLVTQKLKRKIDSSSGVGGNDNNHNNHTAEKVFKFDDGDVKQQGNQGNNANAHINNSSNTTNVSSSTNVGVTGGGQGPDGTQQLPHLSVQIVQQISTQRQSPQTIHTNVTVSSTLQTRYPNNNHQQGGSPAQVGSSNVNVHTSTSSQQQSHSTSVSASTTTNNLNNPGLNTGVGGRGPETSVHTSIECKQEPGEDVHCRVSDTCGSAGGVPGIDIDELQDILDSIEKEDGDIPQDLIQELDKFNAIYDKVQRDSENNAAAESSASMFSSLGGCGSPGLCKAAAPFSDPSQQQHGGPPQALTPTMFETAQVMGGLPIRPSPSLVEPTGPAAETLKQMAAQHQHQVSAAPPFPGKSMDHYSDPYDPFGRSRNGYPSAYASQGYGAAGTGAGYPGYGQSGYGDTSPQLGQYANSKPDLAALAYGTTKPLTHYPGDGHGGPGGHGGQPPSSLQQLQNQVASHFSPGPMHITQTQHVQLAPGAQRVQLSQTQQVQMAAAQHQGVPPPGMTLSQQQSFSMASHMQGAGQGGGQAQPGMGMRDMQFMQEKMRREQQQAAQQQQQQQYMNRPPPEYKMHPASRSAGPPYPGNSAAGGTGGSSTPLQTMQNMVNQTPAYPGVKGEVGQMTQMSAVQSMAASVNNGGQHMGASMAQATQSMAYQQGMPPQRPPSYSPHSVSTCTTPNGVVTTSTGGVQVNSNMNTSTMGTSTHHAPATATTSQVTTGYTSALLRNQRPPNVNVGPEGLNISQPRAHPGHPGHIGVAHPHSHADGWQRGAMMQGHMAGQMARGPGMGGSPVANMMPPGYAHRPGSAGSVGGGMGGAGPMPGGPHPMMSGGVGVSGAQVMMQQSVQMTQRGMSAMRAGVPPGIPPGMGHPQQGMLPHSGTYSMVPHSGAMQTQSNGTPVPQYPGGSGQDDFMHFLDQAQTPGFDSFDSMVSGSTPADFNLFDEILSGGK